ncbi:anti-sigma factor [Cellulomonas sp. PhB150]|uniref:anti-sigma factor n=1 Tax=Cellulomonas sp. PhB150 TaxID=2485188 RepID=UPI000F487135|nr:anti-sigma factor [Cellulomonas sp. PhB150]ROS31304.1 anti-sigma-K factor RskA [Cellulomonas sp. PhB150]
MTENDDVRATGDDVRSLLGAYALDAVDDIERRAVERLVATDADAARELADLLAVAARLGSAVAAEPPAGLRASVLAAVAREARPTSAEAPADGAAPSADDSAPLLREPERPAAVPATSHRAATPRGAQRWWSLAAAVVIGAAVPSALLVQQHQRAEDASNQQQALADVLRDPSAVLVHGDVAGGGTATAVLTDDDALFSATGLPALADGKVYQLWVVNGDEAASAGVLSADGGSVRRLTDDFSSGDALAMTVEPEGGSAQPTTTPVVVLTQS